MDGKIVFITGSTKGIGYAAAQEFLDLGAKVLVNGRDADACREACQKMYRGLAWPGGWGHLDAGRKRPGGEANKGTMRAR
jgi:NAD(P)-dependent dehydrogenase (short-subunit alcohol dehydrogenase family)